MKISELLERAGIVTFSTFWKSNHVDTNCHPGDQENDRYVVLAICPDINMSGLSNRNGDNKLRENLLV